MHDTRSRAAQRLSVRKSVRTSIGHKLSVSMQAWRADPSLLFHLLPLEIYEMLAAFYRGVGPPPRIELTARGDIVTRDELLPGKRQRRCDQYIFGSIFADDRRFSTMGYDTSACVTLQWKGFVCALCMQYSSGRGDDGNRKSSYGCAVTARVGLHCTGCCKEKCVVFSPNRIARVRIPHMLAELSGLVDPRCLDAAHTLFDPDHLDALVSYVSLYPGDDGSMSIHWYQLHLINYRHLPSTVCPAVSAGILLADGQSLRVTISDGSRAFRAPFDRKAICLFVKSHTCDARVIL